jgi:hypothetical protein
MSCGSPPPVDSVEVSVELVAAEVVVRETNNKRATTMISAAFLKLVTSPPIQGILRTGYNNPFRRLSTYYRILPFLPAQTIFIVLWFYGNVNIGPQRI